MSEAKFCTNMQDIFMQMSHSDLRTCVEHLSFTAVEYVAIVHEASLHICILTQAPPSRARVRASSEPATAGAPQLQVRC